MKIAKQEVVKMLSRLPDDCSLEDIQYHLCVLQKIEQGLKEIEAGQFYTHEEVKQWISQGHKN